MQRPGLRRQASATLLVLLIAALGCREGEGSREQSSAFRVRALDSLVLPTPQPAERPRNLLLVSLDTLRADHVSAYGHPRPTTPHLDRLAARGILFENAYSHAPHTAPSHMSLFTSLYPGEHGVRNFEDGGGVRLDERVPTLAQLLQRAGYRTRAVVSGGNVAASLGFDRGFARYDERPSAARWVFDAALDTLRELAAHDAPFFLFVHTYEIHDPYVAPAAFRKLFTDPDYRGSVTGSPEELARRAPGGDYASRHRAFWQAVDRQSPADLRQLVALYDAGIRVADHHLGRLLRELAALGLEEETAVVVLSDHGEEFGEHGGFIHQQVYDEVLRVPLVLRLPGSDAPPGRRVSARVRLIDVLPTVLGYLGVPAPAHLRGESLLPLVEQPVREDRPVFAQHPGAATSALILGSWKAVARPPSLLLRGRVFGSLGLHLAQAARRGELFDLARDRAERVDRAEHAPQRLRAMLDRIDEATRALERSRESLDGDRARADAETRRRLEALGYVDS